MINKTLPTSNVPLEFKMVHKYKIAGFILATIILAIATSVLLGWYFDIQILKSIVPGIVNMNPTTATCFLLLSTSLFILTSDTEKRLFKLIVVLSGLLVMFIGISMIVKFVGGPDIHIDQQIFREKILQTTAFSNNRIAPNTALNLVLSGFALIALLFKRYKFAQSLSFVTGAITLMAIIGYMYGVKNLYGILSYTPMALNTAISFLLFVFAINAAKSDKGYMALISSNTNAGRLLRNVLPAVVIVPIVLGEFHTFLQTFFIYNEQFGLSLIIVLVAVIFTIIFYYSAHQLQVVDSKSKLYEQELIKKTGELELAKQAADIANATLDSKLSNSELQNTTLQDTKRAMLNLLEDLNQEKQHIVEQQAKDEALLGSIGDAVFAIDKDQKIILFNPVAAELSGYTQVEAIGKPYRKILNFILEDNQQPNIAFIEKALTGVKTGMMNHTALVTKDGNHVPVADSASPVFDADGKVTGVVVVFRDVTIERKIDKAKTEFVSLASHQLRTPLSAINWYTELLLGGDAGKITKEQKEFLQQIYESNQRMVDLVNSLLNVSRIDMGTLASEPEATDIEALTESVLAELQPQVAEKKEKIVKVFALDKEQFSVDPKLMRILIQNLLSNAIKYTPDNGQIKINLSKDSEWIHVSVHDTGYGIPKNQQNKIFTKLFRADNAKEKVTDGNGLGLYMVKSIVDTHGGKIRFDSQENKGTTFYIDLPVTGMKKIEGSKTLS